jgi:hypothetical protein
MTFQHNFAQINSLRCASMGWPLQRMNPFEVTLICVAVPSDREQPNDVAFDAINQANVVRDWLSVAVCAAAEVLLPLRILLNLFFLFVEDLKLFCA